MVWSLILLLFMGTACVPQTSLVKSEQQSKQRSKLTPSIRISGKFFTGEEIVFDIRSLFQHLDEQRIIEWQMVGSPSTQINLQNPDNGLAYFYPTKAGKYRIQVWVEDSTGSGSTALTFYISDPPAALSSNFQHPIVPSFTPTPKPTVPTVGSKTSNEPSSDFGDRRPKTIVKNLLANPDFINAQQWYQYEQGKYRTDAPLLDKSHSFNSIGHSIKLFHVKDKVSSSYVPVVEGKRYTFSFMALQKQWPGATFYINIGFRNSKQKWVVNSRSGTMASLSKINQWEEVAVTFKVPRNRDIHYASISVGMRYPVDGVEVPIWVDHMVLAEGLSFQHPPSPKKPFVGAYTRVDSLGNIEVFKAGKWEPFFPICIYADNRRTDWSLYAQQGFNCNMWASSANSVKKGKDVGLMSGLQFAQYLFKEGFAYHQEDTLRKNLREISKQGLDEWVLWHYWDNEKVWDQWRYPKHIVDIIQKEDLDAQGKRKHPIYILNGASGIARRYNNAQAYIGDITGDYVGTEIKSTGSFIKMSGLRLQDHIEGQQMPVVVAQINYGIGKRMRAAIFASIAYGARAIGHWRDFYNDGRPGVERREWWNEFPQIVDEIHQMMPLIRKPHWTKWKLSTSSTSQLEYGTRTYNGKGYVILANANSVAVKQNFKIENLAYTPKAVTNFFSKKTITAITQNQFKITVPAFGSLVIELSP